jgi:23S rRNA (adenine2503-C2)-methyltransferase
MNSQPATALPPTLPDIRSLGAEELRQWVATQGEKPFRAKQLWQWLWAKDAPSLEAMTDLPKGLRAALAAQFSLTKPAIVHEARSSDGSIKYGLAMADGSVVETVLIPTDSRVTVCISSQVGCSLTCKFCATGYMPLKRNLEPWEIADQVSFARREAMREYGRSLTNIVYMGMGEPLLNYRNMMASIERVTAPDGLGISPRRITVSTAGIAKLIRRLADDDFRCEFALSLHAATDVKRAEIMPINESNTLEALADSLQYFHDKTGTRVTFEYICFDQFNDSLDDAQALVGFARQVPCKINLIEYNPIQEAGFRNASGNRMHTFRRHLEANGLIVNVRRSRGRDVDGGCGQLAIRLPKVPLAIDLAAG